MNDDILAEAQSNSQKDHASFLEPAIKKLCEEVSITLNTVDGISVINGPGSYTGLRVGLSSAKALCFALEKPLILLNTLDVMAYALKLQSTAQKGNLLFCPLIDARRMEVFTALYDSDLCLIKNYAAQILEERFLEEERKTNNVIVGGSGTFKLQKILNDSSVIYVTQLALLKPMAILSNKAFVAKQFSEIAYSEPFYLKPVYFRK